MIGGRGMEMGCMRRAQCIGDDTYDNKINGNKANDNKNGVPKKISKL